MNEKNDVQVIINGKQYTLCGYESNDYLQHIANHINDKFAEFKKQEDYNRLDIDMRNILLAINLSDDFFKAQKLADGLKQQLEELEQEIFDMKHEIMKRDEELKDARGLLDELEEKNAQIERSNIQMEMQLKQKEQELQKRAAVPVSAGQVGRPVMPPQAVRPGQPTTAMIGQPVQNAAAQGMPGSVGVQNMPGGQQKTTGQAVSAAQAVVAQTAAAQEEAVMTGIEPAAKPQNKAAPAIPEFELETALVEEENAGEQEEKQSGTRGRKNSRSKRSQRKK